MGWMSGGAGLLLQAVTALPDTIYTKQIVAEPGLWDKITSIASGVMTITVIVLTVALVPAAWNFRKSYKKISDMLDKVYGDVNPLMRHASAIADNVDYISTAMRVDVQQVSQTVAAVNQRLQQAVGAAEERINQLNALLDVVQEEAESAFVTTASTIRGVQTGINQAFDEEDWRNRARVSDPEMDQDDEREQQYDLLTAALIGAAVGAGITLLLRRGPSGRRPVGHLAGYAGRGAALAGLAGLEGAKWAGSRGLEGARWAGGRAAEGARWAAPRARRGFRTAVERGEEMIDRIPVDDVVEQVRDYVDTARDAINDVVKDELNDLRKAVRRQRKRIGI